MSWTDRNRNTEPPFSRQPDDASPLPRERCDAKCPAQAAVRVSKFIDRVTVDVPGTRGMTGPHDLVLCAHHFADNHALLVAYGWTVIEGGPR